MSVDEVYQEILLDHFKHPRCQQEIPNPTGRHEAYNPLCGDRISAAVSVRDGVVAEVSFRGQGCCISQASMSILSELILGKSLEDAGKILGDYDAMMNGTRSADELPQLGEARCLEGVKKFSARLKCALLGCGALERCIERSAP